MLAYVFWHRRSESLEAAEYERRLLAFHQRIGDALAGSAAFRLERLPFDPRDGYEDWYLVEDWGALGGLNAAAVSGAHAAPHDAVAGAAAEGWGGLYSLVDGTPDAPAGALWLDRPRGAAPADVPLTRGAAQVWQRLMVLGPGPELCVGTPAEPGRHRLWPPAADR